MTAEVEEVVEKDDSGSEVLAYMREIRGAFEEYIKTNKKIPKEVLKSLSTISDPARFADVSVTHLPLQTKEKQETMQESCSVVRRKKKWKEARY